MKNRERRSAKQRKRAQRQAPPRREHRHAGGDEDAPALVATGVYAAADAVRRGDGEEARELIELLELGPPVPDGRALVTRVLDSAVRQQRAWLSARGWTAADLGEFERRRLKVRTGVSDIERGVRLLGLLSGLGPLPDVAPPRPTSTADDGMLAKIRALLAKAESTTFPEEAEALSAKAQELMARHRIDRVLVDGASGGRDHPVGRRIWLDDPYADAKAHVLAEVAAANRCRAVLLDSLGCAHVVGFPTDLDLTELLHTSLLVQATRAMATAGPQTDARGRSRTRSFRQSFLIAYAYRIGQRLREKAAATEAEVDAAESGRLLPALAGRDRRVEDVVATAFPKMRRLRVSASNGAGWAAGTAAADLADLSVGERLEAARQELPARPGTC